MNRSERTLLKFAAMLTLAKLDGGEFLSNYLAALDTVERAAQIRKIGVSPKETNDIVCEVFTTLGITNEKRLTK
ncbi:MAG: hypothetical protein ACI4NP_00470 [Thermoguttaceae bacterium]